MNDHVDRAVGALVGLAVGDALGSTLEFSRRDSKPVVTDLIGGGPFGLRPGEWTDDTSMALCLADSLISKGGLDGHDLLTRFVDWWRNGTNSVTGACFDIGNTTRESLGSFERSGALMAGPEDRRQAGNGSLMRLAPVAIFCWDDAAQAEEMAAAQSETTHPAPVAHDACRLFARMLVEAIDGTAKGEVLSPREWSGTPEVGSIARGDWREKGRGQIHSTGYSIDTLEAAIWCVANSDSFEEAVILAANLGDDADTVAAVTGQLAGAIWGRASIPEPWVAKLAWADDITAKAEELLHAGAGSWRDMGRRPGRI
jgi:ADP-ribosyl-[dinitrogen reductase] hydrolase